MKIDIKEHFKEITPEEGYVLTDWDEVEILVFAFYEKMAVPFNFDESVLKEITIEEKDRLLKEQEEEYERSFPEEGE